MLYNLLKSVITNKSYLNNGDTYDTMQTKLDVFYAKGRLTQAQYTELTDLLTSQNTTTTDTTDTSSTTSDSTTTS